MFDFAVHGCCDAIVLCGVMLSICALTLFESALALFMAILCLPQYGRAYAFSAECGNMDAIFGYTLSLNMEALTLLGGGAVR